MEEPKLVVVGRIIRAVGTDGRVEVELHTDDPARFSEGSELLLQPPAERRSSLTVKDPRPKGDRVQVRFEGLDDRTAAQELVGRYLAIGSERLRHLPAGEFWVHDLIGCRVVTEKGAAVGEVVDVLQTGSNDVYVVREGEKELLIPAIKDVVVGVDTAAKRIVIRPMPGLLE